MVTYIGIHRKYSDTFKTHHSERPQVKLWEIDPNKYQPKNKNPIPTWPKLTIIITITPNTLKLVVRDWSLLIFPKGSILEGFLFLTGNIIEHLNEW